MIARRALLLATGAAPWVPRRGAGQSGTLTNLMPAFWQAYDAAREGSFEDRGRALIASYIQPNLEHYRAAGMGRVDIARWLAEFDPIAPDVRRLSEGVSATWSTHAARFARAFPDFDPAARVTILVSFLLFDARVRAGATWRALFIGLDGVVRFGASLPVLLAHECFHLYHYQVNPTLILPEGDTAWINLWKEGLAVHAGAVLNPEADARTVMMGDAVLAGADAALLRRLAAAILPVLDERGGPTHRRFFDYDGDGTLPARGGYLLGVVVARRLAAGRDLATLARIPAAEARALIRLEIQALAQD